MPEVGQDHQGRLKRAPLRLGTLLGLIGRSYRAHVLFLVLGALIIVVPAALLEVLGERLGHVGGDDAVGLARVLVSLLAAALLGFGASVGDQLYTGLISSTVAADRAGRTRPKLAEVLRELPIMRLVAADIVYSVAVAAGLLLFIVPAIVLATWWALLAPVIELERPSLRAAFKRSRELVRGYFWTVFAVVLVFTVLGELLATGLREAVPEHSLLGDWLGTVASDLAATPLYGVAIATLALELIARKPGPGAAPD